jgi:hypothetical protein
MFVFGCVSLGYINASPLASRSLAPPSSLGFEERSGPAKPSALPRHGCDRWFGVAGTFLGGKRATLPRWPEHPIDFSVEFSGRPEQRVRCATFGLRLPPQHCCSPRGHLLIMLEPRTRPRHHPVTSHCRTPLGRHPAMNHRRTPTGYLPVIAHPGSTVHHLVMCHRRTLMGRHPDIAHLLRHHPVTGHCRTLMGRQWAMAHPAATVRHHARTSHHRTLTGRHPVMAPLRGTACHQSTVRHHAVLTRTQFRGRAPTPATRSSGPLGPRLGSCPDRLRLYFCVRLTLLRSLASGSPMPVRRALED